MLFITSFHGVSEVTLLRVCEEQYGTERVNDVGTALEPI